MNRECRIAETERGYPEQRRQRIRLQGKFFRQEKIALVHGRILHQQQHGTEPLDFIIDGSNPSLDGVCLLRLTNGMTD